MGPFGMRPERFKREEDMNYTNPDIHEFRMMQSHLRASPEFAAYMVSLRVLQRQVKSLDLRDPITPPTNGGISHV